MFQRTLGTTFQIFRVDCFSATNCLVWLVASAVLVVAGPFGTFEHMTFSERLLFWPILLAASLIMSYFVRSAVIAVAPDQHPFARDAISIVIFGSLFAPMPTVISYLATWAPPEPVLPFIDSYLLIIVVTSAIAVLRHVLGIEKPNRQEDSDPRPRFLRRLDDDISAEQVLRLTVDDHYVELYLTNGQSHRVLIRFADAVEEMDGIEGMCVHRSHWIAAHAIQSVEKDGSRETVILSDGSNVPVSRTYRQNLVDAGWIVDRRRKTAAQEAVGGQSAQQTALVRIRS